MFGIGKLAERLEKAENALSAARATLDAQAKRIDALEKRLSQQHGKPSKPRSEEELSFKPKHVFHPNEDYGRKG